MRYVFTCILVCLSVALIAQNFENFKSVDGAGAKSSKTYIINAEEGDTLLFDYRYDNSTHKMPNECYISFDQEEVLSFGQSSVDYDTKKIYLSAGEHSLVVSVWTQSRGPILYVRNVQILKNQQPDAVTAIREDGVSKGKIYSIDGSMILTPKPKSIFIYKGKKYLNNASHRM